MTSKKGLHFAAAFNFSIILIALYLETLSCTKSLLLVPKKLALPEKTVLDVPAKTSAACYKFARPGISYCCRAKTYCIYSIL